MTTLAGGVSKPTAIPTVYKNVQMKSRLEAQTAFLFDKLGWEWQYEPQSYMLPNGVSYTPDFLLKGRGTIWECRGYRSPKGNSQIQGFCNLLDAEDVVIGAGEFTESILHYVLLNGDRTGLHFSKPYRFVHLISLIHCKECGWRLGSISSGGQPPPTWVPELFCTSCIAPMFPPPKWQGEILIDKSAIVTADAGKVLVNGSGIEEFHW